MKEIREAVEFYRNWKTGEVRDCEEVNKHKEALVRFAEIFLSRCQELNVVYGEGIDEAIDQMVVDKTIASKYIDEISRSEKEMKIIKVGNIRASIGALLSVTQTTLNEVQVLIDLAEKVLAVEWKMPEKMTIFRSGDEEILFTHNDIRRRINETIDQCTLAITGALLSVQDIEKVLYEWVDKFQSVDTCKAIACAIHSAQMEKLWGE